MIKAIFKAMMKAAAWTFVALLSKKYKMVRYAVLAFTVITLLMRLC
jgi:hypothetical protein